MLKKILVFSLILILILIVGAVVYVNNVLIPKHLKPAVTEALEKALDKKVSIEQASYFPFKGVSFSGIDIRNQDDSLFIAAENIDLRLRSFPRLKPKDVSAKAGLTVSGFMLRQEGIEISANTRVDLDAQLKQGQPPKFSVKANLKDAALKGLNQVPAITGINGELIATDTTFHIKQISADILERTAKISGRGTYTAEDADIEEVVLQFADNTRLTIKGTIKDLKTPQLNVTAVGDIDLQEISILLAQEELPATGGIISIDAQAQGPAQIDTIEGKASIRARDISYNNFKVATIDIDAVLSQGLLTCNPCNVTCYNGSIMVLAKAQLDDSLLPVELNADVKGLDLLPLITDATGYDAGGGIVDAHLAVSGPVQNINSLTGSGWLKMVDGTIQIPNLYANLAKSLGMEQLQFMVAREVSATFSIYDAKVETQDLLVLTDLANVEATGWLGFDQSLEAEALLRMTAEAVDKAGGVGSLSGWVSDQQGLAVNKIKVWGNLTNFPQNIRYKTIPMPMDDILQEVAPQAIEKVIQDHFGEDADTEEVKELLNKGLQGIFGK